MHLIDYTQMLVKSIDYKEFTNSENIVPSTFIGVSIFFNSFLHMFYLGFNNPNYFKCLLTNTSLIFLMIIFHIFIKYRSIIDNQNYSWFNILFDVPITSFILTNILTTKHGSDNNTFFKYANPFFPIETNDLYDGNIDELNNESNQVEQTEQTDEDGESDETELTDETDGSDKSDETNESNQTENLNENLNEDNDEEPDENDTINKILLEKYNNYMNSVIYEYEYRIAEIKENMRLNSKDISNIKLVLEGKISEREQRILIRTLNMIIQDKIVSLTDKTENLIVSDNESNNESINQSEN